MGTTRLMLLAAVSLAAALAGAGLAEAADWPMWRCDAGRTGATSQELADTLYRQWTIRLPALTPAWPDQEKLWFDLQYEPVVAGGRLFLGSSRDDSIRAYDMLTGESLWTFLVDGPVRFAPVAWCEKVYAVCDDGYLYCLAAADGRLLWKFRGGPGDRKLLGNERLISTWPARGAPVIAEDTLYFAAGIWPFMGTFIHALDAETGAVRWTTDGDGSMYIKQPHNTDSFAGVAPQGHLVVAGDCLLLPGGRSVPACYNRHTGQFVYYRLADSNKKGGSSAVAAEGELFYTGGQAYRLDTGDLVEGFRAFPALAGRRAYVADSGTLRAFELGDPLWRETEGKDRRGNPITISKLNLGTGWTSKVEGSSDVILTGRHLAWCGEQVVGLTPLPNGGDSSNPATCWSDRIDGAAVRVVAAEDRLLVVTLQGEIHCYGAGKVSPRVWESQLALPTPTADDDHRAEELLAVGGTTEGYCLTWGAGTGTLLPALLSRSQLHVIAIERQAKRAESLREQLAAVYGQRAQVLTGTPSTIEIAPYLASLMICEDAEASGMPLTGDGLSQFYELLRPYGGTAVLKLNDVQHEQLQRDAKNLSNAEVRREGHYTLLIRSGALEGSANWTHEHADASNTRTSRDTLVRLPLGVLWFGGPSHDAILPRHGHGPQPQVVDGRVIIEGPDLIRAVDAYTGRLLWEREWHEFGKLYDNTSHHPGANGTGGNYVSLSDGIYAIHGPECVWLDPATGKILNTFRPPFDDHEGEPALWTYINAVDQYLIGGFDLPERDGPKRTYADYIASERLAVFNRYTGELLWMVDAEFEFRNNAICAGGGRLYAIDLLSKAHQDQLKRRGLKATAPSKLLVFELDSGSRLWADDDNVFGTWLSYSSEYDVLVESGRPGRDVLSDEPTGMRAWQASDGRALWRENYRGPAILHGNQVLADREACELLTGRPITRRDPLTGREVPWTWTRNYGCNTPQACENLILFRSGAAGYYDLADDGGTGNFGGFKSSCTNNLIAACGLLNAPEYTRTCVCDYQNQTSLALVHMPDVELWTQFTYDEPRDVRHLAWNLGAPGQRRDASGRLWLDQYAAGKVKFDQFGYYRRHATFVDSSEMPWVAASGCRGIEQIEVDPRASKDRKYTLRLYFCDPDNDQPGQRRFDVYVDGRVVLEGFDIVAEAGGARQMAMHQLTGIRLGKNDKLTIEFRTDGQRRSDPTRTTLLSGLELVQE